MVTKNKYKAPVCCKKPMKLVSTMKVDSTFVRFF